MRWFFTKSFFWGFFVSLIGLSFAQTPQHTPEEIREMTLEDLMNIRITTSSKTEQMAWEAPTQVIVISRQQIQERGYLDLLDLLRDLPYFQIQSEHGHWTKGAIVNLRGHRSGDSGNNKFLILQDGIKLSDDAAEGLYLGMRSLPLSSIEQVEIVYGPNSTLYGRDAYAGMINLITRKKPLAYSQISYGTYHSWQIAGGMYQQFSDDLSGNLYFTSYQSDEQDPTGISETYLHRHVFPAPPYTERFYRASKNLALDFGLNYRSLKFRYLRYDIEGSETYGSNPDLYVTEYSTVAAQKNEVLSFDFQKKFATNFTGSFYYIYKKYEFHPRTANLYTDDLNRTGEWDADDSTVVVDPFYAYGGRKYYYFRTRAHKTGIKIEYAPATRLKNVSGIDAHYIWGIPIISEGKGGKPITTKAQRDALEHHYSTVGLYTEFRFYASPNWLLTMGGRFDLNSDYQNIFNPRMAVIYRYKKHLFKTTFATGYLLPSVTQVYFESKTTFSWIRPNLHLRPEKNSSFEFDWTYSLDHSAINANFFYNWLIDGIIESVMTGDSAFIQVGDQRLYVPVLQSENLSQGYRWGFSLEFKTRLSSHFEVQTFYAFLDGEDLIENTTVTLRDNLIAPHQFFLGLYYRAKKFSLYGSLNWLSQRRIRSYHTTTQYAEFLDSNGYLNFDPIPLVNLNLRLNRLAEGVSVFLRVKNLFNRKYYGQTINAAWGNPKVLQDLRRIDAGIHYEF